MDVTIPHRFLERLLPSPAAMVKILVVGTFNPGEPTSNSFSDETKNALDNIFNTPKYQKFKEVRNFYDRPQNRFWGILDRIAHPGIYQQHGMQYRHTSGIKHFKQMDRSLVFERQQAFCAKHGLFISDIVRTIKTSHFQLIYNRFEDVHIDPVAAEWNTKQLIKVIQTNPGIKLILNFKQSPSIPRISEQVALLKQAAPLDVLTVSSSSGAA